MEARELEIVSQNRSLALPEMDIETAVERFKQLGQFVKTIMRPGTDYGVIPGTGKRKIMLPEGETEVPTWTLLKPGAEKLCTFFGLTKEEEILESEKDWTGKEHGGEPFFYFHYLIRLSRNDRLIAEADGSANSWETKHRYRQGEYKCPKCGKETIRRSKEDKGGGYYCWSKLGGCGAQFKKGDSVIESQDVGKRKNPDPADLVNTIQKMAYKRALVAATLVAVNASEYFTQDIEDLPEFEHPEPPKQEQHKQEEPKQSPKAGRPTLEERRQKAVTWLMDKGKTLGDGEGYLQKDFDSWDESDLKALGEWGKANFPPVSAPDGPQQENFDNPIDG